MYSSAGEGNPAEMRWRSSGNSQTAGLLAAGRKKGRTAADVPKGMSGIRVVIFGLTGAGLAESIRCGPGELQSGFGAARVFSISSCNG